MDDRLNGTVGEDCAGAIKFERGAYGETGGAVLPKAIMLYSREVPKILFRKPVGWIMQVQQGCVSARSAQQNWRTNRASS